MDAVDKWMTKQDNESTVAHERNVPFIGVQHPHLVDMAAGDVSGDAPDCGDELNRFLKRGTTHPEAISVADDYYKVEQDPLMRFIKKQMFMKERKEHPSFTDEQIDQIVKDHFEEGEYDG